MTQTIPSAESADTVTGDVADLPSGAAEAPQVSAVPVAGSERGILMSEAALAHVKALRDKQEGDLCLRVGVR
ncbi:MAG: hypothetical protein AAF528_10995, partial [Cyanobacteria bacterium P01_C01_bin.121]